MITHLKVVAVTVIAVMSVTFTTAQFPKLELKKSKNFLTIPVSVIRHRAKELRSWRLNNLVDYITGGKRKVQDIAKPKLKSLGKIKGTFECRIIVRIVSIKRTFVQERLGFFLFHIDRWESRICTYNVYTQV